MQTIELSYPQSIPTNELAETVCAIGFFDGIHKGHQKVIKTAVKEAKKRNLASAVMTFHPHPSVVLNKKIEHVKYITPLREKQKLLQELDIDRLYIIKFNKELSLLSPEEFINHFIIGLHIKHLVAGFDFTFGHKGKGNMKNISSYTKDLFTTTVIPKLVDDNEKISSTRIHKLLGLGQIEEANRLLGRKLSVSGFVVEGDKRGRTIGYPTANVKISNDTLLPAIGVYAVSVYHKNMYYEGMANLGVKPTFESDEREPTLEVNIFDFAKDIYGEEMVIDFHLFIRNEKKFSGIDELVQQLALDEEQIKQYFLKKREF